VEGEKRVIKPTVGRVVLYWPDGPAMKEGGQQPHAAIVAFVHDDRKVNLATFDQYGKAGAVTSVVLRQPDDVIATGAFAEWMPYQISVAAKQDHLSEALAAADKANPVKSG
jgi:hypothetical protein